MANTKVGKIIHYYDKIGVGIIKVAKKLAVGDKIKFVKNKEDIFEQVIDSMEFEHKKIKSAKKGDEVGMKVLKPLKKGVEVYKVG